jgi:hypothetical protein
MVCLLSPFICFSAPTKKQVKNYLDNCCDFSEKTMLGRDRSKEIIEIKLKTLNKYFPQRKFYHVELGTSNYEYSIVQTIVCAETYGKILVVSLCHSPDYDDPSKTFLSKFIHIRANGMDDLKNLCREISELFRVIINNGELKNEQLCNSKYSIELWVNNRLFRNILIQFNQDLAIGSIQLINPMY